MPLEQAVPINLQNAISVIKNFSKNKINSIIPYPLSQENYAYILSKLKGTGENIFAIILNPKLEKALKNTESRKLTNWERKRIEYHYKIKINNPGFGIVVDNTNQTPKETASIILDCIK